MFYQKRIEEIFEKSSKKNQTVEEKEIFEDLDEYKNNVDLESGDLTGMIIGGYYAFWPLFAALLLILILVRPPW